ncbi:dihydropteroate synthase [Anaplasmataceae bacterium AB001_6]|nr:dihydropteroate synthase [Anaplasmataceae bacterium AB001_6]
MKICGIINITPDSFSGDGLLDHSAVLSKVEEMINDGADIIDVGAQATNPFVKNDVDPIKEKKRLWGVLPKIVEIANKSSVMVSIDSYNSAVIQYALESGVHIINDQKGLQDPAVIDLLLANINNIHKIIFMHSVAVPADLDVILSENEDVLNYLKSWAEDRIKYLTEIGFDKQKLVFDPGIGFATTVLQARHIIKNAYFFKQLGVELYIGCSRKRFIEEESIDVKDRITLGISGYLYSQGVDYLRVHEIKNHRKLINLLENKEYKHIIT